MRNRIVVPQIHGPLEEKRFRRRAENPFILDVLDHVKAKRSQIRLPQSGQIRLAIGRLG